VTHLRLTCAQATVRWLAAQHIATETGTARYFAGVWAIFGHGNVAGLGEALAGAQHDLPTYRAHNEQTMAHAAIAFAKQSRRKRAMVCTTSIGPGATNLVTAAALAHANRLPVLLLPGDVFASRRPDPVLQQIEAFGDRTTTANDCLRPVSRFFDRITRPEQILDSLPQALATMLDPAGCGPATVALCQDVQAEAFDYPATFFEPRTWRIRQSPPDVGELTRLVHAIKASKRPVLVIGGGVGHAGCEDLLAIFASRTGMPCVETQAGKGWLLADHALNLGGVGVTGTAAANAVVADADLIIGLGTRLQDFTTGSRRLIASERCRLVQINTAAFDAHKHGAEPVVGDAGEVVSALSRALDEWSAPAEWTAGAAALKSRWDDEIAQLTAAPQGVAPGLPSDAQVLGAVWRAASEDAVVVCAAGGLPGELHKLWRVRKPGGYHVEYGFSCMGYEIAGGLGAKLAEPDRDVHVMVGDGSYLMANSELATSVMLGAPLVVTLLDNRGFGCINRLQGHVGVDGFNNLLDDCHHQVMPQIDFVAHARSLGATAEKVRDIAALETALAGARSLARTHVIVIETDPAISSPGGAWWDVPVAQISANPAVGLARQAYEAALSGQPNTAEGTS
jgi:3D-(3,5/4)-trihydroxycyclohexane-1,2-dione acylhydrolase (decyclizing)